MVKGPSDRRHGHSARVQWPPVQKLAVFLILFVVWLVLSGHFDALHIALGVVCAALVARFSSELLFPEPPSSRLGVITWRVLGYVPWLLYQIVLANLHVLYLVWRPGQLRPQIVRFRTNLTGSLAKVVLGNSITLTPGTITMDLVGDEFTVYAVSDQAASSLRSGEMERRVGYAFLEP